MNAQPSQKDVAAVARVNKSTVSRVLRGRRDVAEATRQRVFAAAEQLGYRLDPVLSRIAAMRWGKQHMHAGNRIAFVESNRHVDNDRYWQGVSRQADPLGYGVDRFCLADYRNGTSVGSVLSTRGIQLVVLAGCDTLERLDGFPVNEFRTVHCGSTQPGMPFCSVMIDLSYALYELWSTARRHGCKRIGLVQMIRVAPSHSTMLMDGYYRALAAQVRQPEMPVLWIQSRGSEAATAGRQLSEWLQHFAPDFVMTERDEVVALAEPLRQLGQTIPPMVSLATDDETGKVAGYRRELGELGALAVRQLHLSYLAGESSSGMAVNSLAEPSWQDGATLHGSVAEWVDHVLSIHSVAH